MKETGLTGKRRSATITATPDDGKSQRKRRRSVSLSYVTIAFNVGRPFCLNGRWESLHNSRPKRHKL